MQVLTESSHKSNLSEVNIMCLLCFRNVTKCESLFLAPLRNDYNGDMHRWFLLKWQKSGPLKCYAIVPMLRICDNQQLHSI